MTPLQQRDFSDQLIDTAIRYHDSPELRTRIPELVEKIVRTENESCGDINQGINDNLEVLQVSGHRDGEGLPDCFLVRDKRTGRVGEYTFNDA